MATLDQTKHDMTPAGELAAERMDAAIAAATAGAPIYPNGTAFVAADMPQLGSVLARHAREYRPVVLVYRDGSERLLTPTAETGSFQELTRARLRFRLLSRALARR